MFQQILNAIENIPFFDSTAFGVIAMVIVGSSWCLVGLVMGDAPKKGIDASLVQLSGAVFSTVFSLVIMVATGTYSTATPLATTLTCLAYFVSCMLNFITLQLMSEAMQCGPNGIVWAIIQSALVFPFLGGILFFGVKFTPLRGIGITLLLTALVLFAFTKNNVPGKKGGKWKLLAFAGLAITAVQQNLTTMPSYFKAAEGVPSIVRALATSVGTLFMAVIWNLFLMNKERWTALKRGVANPILWKYTVILQFFNLLFIYTLFFPGMNVMARAGLGGMCYPMMVGSCIVSFTLSSIWLLREKVSRIQLAALAICIAGLVLICTK